MRPRFPIEDEPTAGRRWTPVLYERAALAEQRATVDVLPCRPQEVLEQRPRPRVAGQHRDDLLDRGAASGSGSNHRDDQDTRLLLAAHERLPPAR